MAKNDAIEVEGKVIDVLPGGKFKVELELIISKGLYFK